MSDEKKNNKKSYILKMGAVGKPIRGTISPPEGRDGRVGTHGVNSWVLSQASLGLHCSDVLTTASKLALGGLSQLIFFIISPCETCFSYIFSFGWSSGGMNLSEAGLEGVPLQRGPAWVYGGAPVVSEVSNIPPPVPARGSQQLRWWAMQKPPWETPRCWHPSALSWCVWLLKCISFFYFIFFNFFFVFVSSDI